uniref:Uncharacterized protein n=1 Tax=Calidris pygmaea TaxID=425635 RepID=A0A8C3JAY2_9CHAR
MPPVSYVHGHQQSRCGNKDQLQGPESDVRDGEKVIIANILAPRLKCVAHKVILFISPDSLCSHNQDHDTEDEQDCEPYLPDTGGVKINKTEINQDRKQIPSIIGI